MIKVSPNTRNSNGKNSESESENIDKSHPYEMHTPIQGGIQTLFTTMQKTF
jgi:hypothetical protein